MNSEIRANWLASLPSSEPADRPSAEPARCDLYAAAMAAAYLGAWIVLLVVVIYGPVLIGALADSSSGVKVEGLNYFADTLLFGAVILSLARATTTRESEGP